MTRILLVRHGETDWNAEGRVQGWTDTDLNERGHAQAVRLAARLASPPLSAIYASDLSRALSTAQAIADPHGLSVVPLANLRERGYGEWEGLTPPELGTRYPDEWDRYHRQRLLDVSIPGGETWPEVAARIVPTLHQILDDHPGPDETVALVGHGGSLRAAVLDALTAPLSVLLNMRLDNASLSRLDYGSDGEGIRNGRVVFLNDTSHLEGEL